MLNEESAITKIMQTTAFMLLMLAIGVTFGPEWAIIALLSLIYIK